MEWIKQNLDGCTKDLNVWTFNARKAHQIVMESRHAIVFFFLQKWNLDTCLDWIACHECQLEILANILLTSSWLFLAGKFKNYACRIVTVILFFLPWNWSFNLCTSRHNESPVRVGMRCHLSFEERGKDFVPKFSNFFNNGREDELNVGTAIWVWKMSIAQYGHH